MRRLVKKGSATSLDSRQASKTWRRVLGWNAGDICFLQRGSKRYRGKIVKLMIVPEFRSGDMVSVAKVVLENFPRSVYVPIGDLEDNYDSEEN